MRKTNLKESILLDNITSFIKEVSDNKYKIIVILASENGYKTIASFDKSFDDIAFLENLVHVGLNKYRGDTINFMADFLKILKTIASED